MAPHWGIVVTEEMDEAMKRIVEERGTTISGVVRQLVERYLTEQGQPVAPKIRWGGKRERRKKSVAPSDSAQAKPRGSAVGNAAPFMARYNPKP